MKRTGRTSKMINDFTRYNGAHHKAACDPLPDVLAAMPVRCREYDIPLGSNQ